MLEIFQYDFMQRAFIAGIATVLAAPAIGMFLVVRRLSLISDTLAHVSLVGVAFSFLLKLHPLLTALVAALVAAIGIERLRGTGKTFSDSVLALFLSGSLALAVVLTAVFGFGNANLLNYLFGSIATVSASDVWTIGIVCLVVGAAVAVFYKQFLFVAFSEELAQANGLNVPFYNYLLIILAALTIGISIRVVGALLIGALMVIPVVSALQYKFSFGKTLLLASVFSLFSVTCGLFLSYYLNSPAGGTIVVLALILFAGSLIINRQKIYG